MRLVYCLTALWMFTSCASVKSHRSSEVNRKISQTKDVESDLSQEMLFRLFRKQFSNSLNQTRVTLYDTSQEVDRETGKPPVLAEIENSIQTETTTYTQTERSDSIYTSVRSTSSVQDNESTKEKTDKKKGRTPYRLLLISILPALGIILYFTKKTDK